MDAATDRLWLSSESDARVRFVNAGAIGTQPLTEQLVREKLGAGRDALEPTSFGSLNDPFVKLADRTAEPVRDAKAFLDRLSTPADPNDDAGVAQALRWAQLSRTLQGNLPDFQVYRFGTVNIWVQVVGRTKATGAGGGPHEVR